MSSQPFDPTSLTAKDRKLLRREWLKISSAGLGMAGLGLFGRTLGAKEPELPDRALGAIDDSRRADLRITDVRAILCQPSVRLAVVRVETSEPGLYGVGCATFTQRIRLVEQAVNDYLRPFLIGKDPTRIEDIWQSNFVSSYWRNGPVLMNALSGVDTALWDILGKRAGLPLYDLLGGKARDAVLTYTHVQGRSNDAVANGVNNAIQRGFRVVRIQIDTPGGYAGGGSGDRSLPENMRTRVYDPREYALAVPRMFEHVRSVVGDEVELLHDIHERLPPILAIQLCKDLEVYRPFFIEDPFAPEDNGYFRILRQQTSTPIAMGELFNNPNEYVPLISERLIDLHPLPRLAGRRPLDGPEDRGARRVLQRADRVARPGRHVARGARRADPPGPCHHQLRRAGVAQFQPGRTGVLPGLPGVARRLLPRQRPARSRDRRRRGGRRALPDHRRPALRHDVGQLPPGGRQHREAVRPGFA